MIEPPLRPRVLLVTPILPWPLTRGGGEQRTELLHRALSQFADVDIAHTGEQTYDPESPAARRFRFVKFLQGRVQDSQDHLLKRIAKVKAAHYPAEFFLRLRSYRADRHNLSALKKIDAERAYDLIVFRYVKTAAICGYHVLRNTPFIIDVDDVDWHIILNQRSTASAAQRLAVGVALAQRKYIVKAAIRAASAYFTCSREDRDEIDVAGGTVLPNVPYDEIDKSTVHKIEPNRESDHLVFVVTLLYPPNLNGLREFIANSWPEILRRYPRATLRVVGGVHDAIRQEFADVPHVELAGFVPDLVDEYRKAAFSIAPIRQGGGTKIKVVESLAFGRTCVVTPNSLHGYEDDFRPGESLLLATTPAEMADCCVRLLEDPDLRDRLADEGARIAKAKFSVAHFMGTVEATCRAVIQRRSGGLAIRR